MAGTAFATEYKTASLAYCTSKWGAQPELLARCNEHQELAKARYRERLARGIAAGNFQAVRACREQAIDDALDRGLNPADLNWFAFEDCFLSGRWPGFETLVEEWDGVDRDSHRFECSAQTADQLDDFYRHWVGDIPGPTSFFREFDFCYFEAVAKALGYDTDCDDQDAIPSDSLSKGCLHPWSITFEAPKYSDEEFAKMRAKVRQRRCEWGVGTVVELAELCAGVEPKAE